MLNSFMRTKIRYEDLSARERRERGNIE